MDITQFFIDENKTVIEAMECLDKMAKKVLFIQKKGKLQAALTDGDIRRWILAKGNLNAQIKNVANYNPKYLIDGTYEQAMHFMKEKSIEAVPIVDEELNIKDVIFWAQEEKKNVREQINLPVVMMAGGKGTRLYPYTKILPKPLIPIGDIPIAEHIINCFREYGCQDFFLIINHKKNMIKAYFNEIDRDYKINYIEEEVPLGTGGGLSLLKGEISSTFILTNCDILIKEDMAKIVKYHRKHQNMITMVCALQNVQIPYGVVNMGTGGTIESMEEKPILSFFTNTGCYVVEPQVIEELEEGKSIGFPDVVEKYREKDVKVGVYPIGEHAWMDMGQMDELEKMKKYFEQ